MTDREVNNMRSGQSSNKVMVVIIFCVTAVLLSAIGSWVYISRQQMEQKDRELQQSKELKEYEQDQINQRESKRQSNERLNQGSNCKDWFTGC